jgi:hypothetical protein
VWTGTAASRCLGGIEDEARGNPSGLAATMYRAASESRIYVSNRDARTRPSQTVAIRRGPYTSIHGPRETANGSHIGDAPVLPDLLDQIPIGEEIGSVTADGAYDTRKCHDAIADRGALAVIPPRKNAKPWKTVTAGAAARNEILRASKYLGRALWRRWSGYHRRSRVETKMHCVKLLGQRLMARDFDRQVAELQVRIAVLNGYTALGIPISEAVG